MSSTDKDPKQTTLRIFSSLAPFRACCLHSPDFVLPVIFVVTSSLHGLVPATSCILESADGQDLLLLLSGCRAQDGRGEV